MDEPLFSICRAIAPMAIGRLEQHIELWADQMDESCSTAYFIEPCKMKSTAKPVDIGCGGIVDDAVLVAALPYKRIATAGLAVNEIEPAVCSGLLARQTFESGGINGLAA